MSDTKHPSASTRAMMTFAASLGAMGDSFGHARSSIESFSRMPVLPGPEMSNGPKRRRSKRSARVAAANAREGNQ